MPISVLLLLLAFLLASPVGAQTTAPARIRDLANREVTVAAPARRILIDDGRYLVALSLLHPDPVSLLAAWPRDINRIGQRVYDQLEARFPAIARVASVPSSAGSFSMERVLAVQPDVAIFTLGGGPSADQIRHLEAAGIAVVFLDFFTHPFTNLGPSLEVLGRLIGREAAAAEFLAFRNAHLAAIATRVRDLRDADRPTVFLEAHAGISADCCNSPGKGNIGEYVEMVGGHNIGADVLPGAFGRINIEYVLARDPVVYVATGGPHLEKVGGLVVGQGYTVEQARRSLAAAATRPGIASIGAVKRGRVHGLAHQLLNSPLDILAVEALAKWIHPELFVDLAPEATLAELNRRFLAVPLQGTYWVGLR